MDPEPTFLTSFIPEEINSWFLLSLGVLIILLILSALISGSEVAFFTLTKSDIDKASESKSNRLKTVVKLLKTPQKLLATILIANNFINILFVLVFAFVGDEFFKSNLSDVLKFVIEVLLVTFLILLFGEVLPKIYATRNALKFASIMAYPLNILNSLLSILSAPLLSLTSFLEHKLGKKQSNLSVEKLSQALDLTSNEETTKNEHKILKGIVSFGNTETSQIMVPRIDVFVLSSTDTFDNVVSKIVNEGFSRIPVYEENVDEIIGVLYAKDLLPHFHKTNFKWQELIRQPYFVPENKKLDDLLKEFQEKKNHLAVVVDEYGGTSGVITLEDVIEEIVGDISDEFDEDDISYSRIDDNTWVLEGKTNLKDFYKIAEIEDSSLFDENKGASETIAGFILEVHGKYPKLDKIIQFYNYSFKIEAIDNRRIKQVKVTIDR